jgi:hypothetical protein
MLILFFGDQLPIKLDIRESQQYMRIVRANSARQITEVKVNSEIFGGMFKDLEGGINN